MRPLVARCRATTVPRSARRWRDEPHPRHDRPGVPSGRAVGTGRARCAVDDGRCARGAAEGAGALPSGERARDTRHCTDDPTARAAALAADVGGSYARARSDRGRAARATPRWATASGDLNEATSWDSGGATVTVRRAAGRGLRRQERHARTSSVQERRTRSSALAARPLDGSWTAEPSAGAGPAARHPRSSAAITSRDSDDERGMHDARNRACEHPGPDSARRATSVIETRMPPSARLTAVSLVEVHRRGARRTRS